MDEEKVVPKEEKVIKCLHDVPQAPTISLSKIPTVITWKENCIEIICNTSQIKENVTFCVMDSDIHLVLKKPKKHPSNKIIVKKIN